MRPINLLMLLGVTCVCIVLAAPMIGPHAVSISTMLHPAGSGIEHTIFWQIRVPRVLTSLLAGGALALSGMAFQAMFRNPLATPFTLGVSSGASFGAVLGIRLGVTFSLLGISGISICAFVGAVLSILIVYGLTCLRGSFSIYRMLLAGVAMSFFFSSMILFLQYTANLHDSFRLIRWMMGGLGQVGYDETLNILPFFVVGVVILLGHVNELNLLATGEDLAQSRGVAVQRTRNVLFFSISLMVGSVVAVCGPIGFIGMMVPHMCRLVFGPNHRYLLPASLLAGGAFLTICDTVARTVFIPAEIPVGVITSMLGGPFFIWLLFSRSARRFGI